MKEFHTLTCHPTANHENIIQGDNYRITMLTESLIRLEYSLDGVFEDHATQIALNRDFPQTSYRLTHTSDGIEVRTSRIHLIYNEKEFSPSGLRVQVLGNLSAYHSIWRFSDSIQDLKGTARTLDFVDGSVDLSSGVVSKFGYSLLDDSTSQLLLDNGWVAPRKKGIQDLYFFGYGHDYKECLKDFYYLCGKTPMLPRYALGNWWSRFYAYSEETYMALMERFDEENLPFTVAVIDMDWHLTDIDPKYGSGWTGYTWNNNLFPNPARFLEKLHKKGMHATLNVHPADGVRGHEEMYPKMAEALGVDAQNEAPVVFDITNPDFLAAYLKYAHHPHEDIGVDFWWIDWQQGGTSKVEGLDPLWMLNHYHFLDHARNGKRPMTFSRYAGPGSHRYPVGFSGDTITTWDSLDFQPYFTANASNIGYGWWSHDIGGHMMGIQNDEMTGRWTQFGIFTPIMRLHSSSSIFNGKEPWRFKPEVCQIMKEALRFRHRLMPYLYTMNHRAWKEDLPLILPMYYEHPESEESYHVPNQYYFGSALIVAPLTTSRIFGLNVAKVTSWLPEGTWHDIFTGLIYRGGRTLDLYRTLESIPVLAKAGAIVPLTDHISPTEVTANPSDLHLAVYCGANGSFTLYEDDNETCSYEQEDCVCTTYHFTQDGFRISPAKGNVGLIPYGRTYTLDFYGCKETTGAIQVLHENQEIAFASSYDMQKQYLRITLAALSVIEETTLRFEKPLSLAENNLIERAYTFLNQAEISFVQKDELFGLISRQKDPLMLISQLQAMDLEKDLLGALMEFITA